MNLSRQSWGKAVVGGFCDAGELGSAYLCAGAIWEVAGASWPFP